MRVVPFITAVVSGIGLFSTGALARPEYAMKEKLNCSQCHVTPWGGGPRTVFGKIYGTHSQPGSLTSANDLFYGDLRTIAYYPLSDTSQRTNGMATMEAAATANVPVSESAQGSELRALVTFNMAPLTGATLREGYIRIKPGPKDRALPVYYTIGRFYVPFGLLTDEHRTYTRIQTNMTLNNFDVGAAVSWNFGADLHFDLALVNDFQTGGSLNAADLTWGGVLNFRWNPKSGPFLLGASGNFERLLNQSDPYAASFYGGLWFNPLSILYEIVLAKNWNNSAVNTGLDNPGLTTFFISPSATQYASSVTTASSLGQTAQAKYNLDPQWALIYKFDFLAIDADRLGQNFTRHGIGFETYLNSNLILNTRVEFASTADVAAPDETPLAAQDAIFAMLRLHL